MKSLSVSSTWLSSMSSMVSDFCRFYEASVFETTIRVVGGILTAHELSGDDAFLRRYLPSYLPFLHHLTLQLKAGSCKAGPSPAFNRGCIRRPGWPGNLLNIMPTVDWVLLSCGESNRGQDHSSLSLQLVCRSTWPLLAGTACNTVTIIMILKLIKYGALDRAEELVQILMHAFDTPTGIPYGMINLQTQQGRNPTWTQKASILSEFGTEQLELIQTSLKTGNPVYAQKTQAVIKFLNDKYPDQARTFPAQMTRR